MKNRVMEMLVSGLAACLMTGATAWMVFGGDKVTRPEMVAYLDTGGSWNREKGALELEVKTNKDNLSRLEAAVERLTESHRQLVTEQRVLTEQVSRLLSQK